jgi:hypothetical protein
MFATDMLICSLWNELFIADLNGKSKKSLDGYIRKVLESG